MTRKTIDSDVVQRLAKSADFVVLTGGALVLTTALAQPGQPEAVGFFALLVAFACLLGMRGLGLYAPRQWAQMGWTTASSIAICVVAGAALFALSHLTKLQLPAIWIAVWSALCAVHFSITRFIAGLWAVPAAKAGHFKTRIAIVGGGQAAEDALNLLEQSTSADFEVLGLFDDRFDNRSPESVQEAPEARHHHRSCALRA